MWNIFSRKHQQSYLFWVKGDMHSYILPKVDFGCKHIKRHTTRLARLSIFDQMLSIAEHSLAYLQDKHILLKIAYKRESRRSEKDIFDLQINGYKQILAHPKCYVFNHQKLQRIQRFEALGCWLYGNLMPVPDYCAPFERQVVQQLLTQGAIDFEAAARSIKRNVNVMGRQLKKNDVGVYVKKGKITHATLYTCKT